MVLKDRNKTHLVKELADLWFNSIMVLLTYHGVWVEDVLHEWQ